MSELQRVGIIGDGQLGRMMAEANISSGLGLEIGVLGVPNEDGRPSPAAQISGVRQFHGESLYDANAIARLATWADVVTIEVEHVGSAGMLELTHEGYNFQPSPQSIQTIQDKYDQKTHLESHGIPVAHFQWIGGRTEGREALQDIRKEFGQTVMVKAATGGFDGRGNLLLRDGMDWGDIEEKFGADVDNLYAERFVPFARELSLVAVRNYAGQIVTYPVVETMHRDNICHTVYAPARIGSSALRNATELGMETVDTFEGAGVYTVEMFEGPEGELAVNEVAPRVHNSGHWTIEGAETSQFENHLRAIAGMPIGPTAMRAEYKAAVMMNILGTGAREGELDSDLLRDIAVPGLVGVHGYGKTLRAARKVGHITGLGQNMNSAEDNAQVALDQLEGLY